MILKYQLAIAQWFPQQLILGKLHEIRFGVNYDLHWNLHIVDKHRSLKIELSHTCTIIELIHIETNRSKLFTI